MKNRNLILALAISMTSLISYGQSIITIDASQNITNFKFTNSLGERDKNYSSSYSGGYSIGYRYQTDMGLYIPVKLGMRSAGATYVYDNMNYSWNLQYAEARLGIGYNYKFDKLGIHLGVSPYFSYLLKANQRLNNEDFDIRASGTINKIDYGLFISPGVNFQANDLINIYLDLNYMMGLGNLETDEAQKSNNTGYGATLGLAFTIK